MLVRDTRSSLRNLGLIRSLRVCLNSLFLRSYKQVFIESTMPFSSLKVCLRLFIKSIGLEKIRLILVLKFFSRSEISNLNDFVLLRDGESVILLKMYKDNSLFFIDFRNEILEKR